MKIRDATIKDLSPIENIYKEGVVHDVKIQLPKESEKKILRDLIKTEKNRFKKFRKAISSNKEKLLVYEENGKVIGFGSAALKDKKRNAEITLVFLKKEYRGRGIGSKIVKKLLKWMKNHNMKKIEVSSYFKNKSSINLFKKFGFNEIYVMMEKELK